MPTDCISYQNSGYFTPIMIDYLAQKESLKPLYNRFPAIENFSEQIREKASNYPHPNREILVATLEQQCQNIALSKLSESNIELLKKENTFTVTTGHQLNLLTGPLYFVYKIISAINLAKHLKAQYPDNNFVPIYWMATEDHDFEEINFFNFNGRKFRWNRESSGAVGNLDTAGLEEVYRLFSMELGSGINAEYIRKLFDDAYLKHNNLTDATRFLANELFGRFGLVILDGDSVELKKLFIPHIKTELTNQIAFREVTETNKELSEYTVQVNPREINLFYLTQNLRERIVLQDGLYRVNNTETTFSADEILAEVDNHPERFSPNVIMRPLYEEVVLPNLCYIGGGGEIAYWLQLKSYFDASNITFPILLLRNSALLATAKQSKKADALNLSWSDLFTKQEVLLNRQIKALSEFPIDLSSQKQTLQQQFDTLYILANTTDKSFSGAVKAQEAKQLKGLANLEKRLLKAQKRKHADVLERITELQNELFPYQGLQERQTNFAEFYVDAGEVLIEKLIDTLNPLDTKFTILTL